MVYFEPYQSVHDNPSQQVNAASCSIHHDTDATIFCQTCEQFTCKNCTDEHKEHKCRVIEEIFFKNKKEIISALAPVKKRHTDVQQLIVSMETKKSQIGGQRATLEAMIEEEIKQLGQLVQQLRVKSLASLKRLTREKMQSLKQQRTEMEILQKRLKNCVAEANAKLGAVVSVVMERGSLIGNMEKCVAECDHQLNHQEIEADMELHIKGKSLLQQACQEYFEVVTCHSLSIEHSHITGDGLKEAKAGEEKTIFFEAMTRQNEPFEGHIHLAAELVYIRSRDRVQCIVTNPQAGRYSIQYQPVNHGKHELHLTVNGHPVRGSPFSIAVAPWRPIRVVRGMGNPRSTTINSKGEIIVLNSHSVSVLTPEYEIIRAFGTPGSGEGQISASYGITVDKDDNVYVMEYENQRIQKFTPDGVSITMAGSYGVANLEFNNARAIYYNYADNNLYVADSSNHRIQVLTTDLKFVRIIGERGSGSGKFYNPYGLAFDDVNNLYVADRSNNCIQVLTSEGQFLRAFRSKANGELLSAPWAIAIDSSNMVYISEGTPHRVSVFTSQGAYITTFGEKSLGEGNFNQVVGLTADNRDHIITSDCKNKRLQIF